MPSRRRYAPRSVQPSGNGRTSSCRRGPSMTAAGDRAQERHVVERRGDVPRLRVERARRRPTRRRARRCRAGNRRRRNDGRRPQRRARRPRPGRGALTAPPRARNAPRRSSEEQATSASAKRRGMAVPLSSCRASSARRARAPRRPPVRKYVSRLPASVSATWRRNSSDDDPLLLVRVRDERDLDEHRRRVHADEDAERRLLHAARRDPEQPVEVGLHDLGEARGSREVLVLREVPEDEVEVAHGRVLLGRLGRRGGGAVLALGERGRGAVGRVQRQVVDLGAVRRRARATRCSGWRGRRPPSPRSRWRRGRRGPRSRPKCASGRRDSRGAGGLPASSCASASVASFSREAAGALRPFLVAAVARVEDDRLRLRGSGRRRRRRGRGGAAAAGRAVRRPRRGAAASRARRRSREPLLAEHDRHLASAHEEARDARRVEEPLRRRRRQARVREVEDDLLRRRLDGVRRRLREPQDDLRRVPEVGDGGLHRDVGRPDLRTRASASRDPTRATGP